MLFDWMELCMWCCKQTVLDRDSFEEQYLHHEINLIDYVCDLHFIQAL